MIEILAADPAVAKIESAGGRYLVHRQHIFIDRPAALDLRVEAGVGAAVEIGMVAQATGPVKVSSLPLHSHCHHCYFDNALFPYFLISPLPIK